MGVYQLITGKGGIGRIAIPIKDTYKSGLLLILKDSVMWGNTLSQSYFTYTDLFWQQQHTRTTENTEI